jgi:hypothetical protein
MEVESSLPCSQGPVVGPYLNEIKNAWSCISTPPNAFMVWCSVKSRGTDLPLSLKEKQINLII